MSFIRLPEITCSWLNHRPKPMGWNINSLCLVIFPVSDFLRYSRSRIPKKTERGRAQKVKAGAMSHCIKCFLPKCEQWSWVPSTHIMPSGCAWEAEQGSLWLSRLAESVSSVLNRETLSQCKRGKQWRMAPIPTSGLHMHIACLDHLHPHHACSHLNMYTHMHSHMQAHTQRGEGFILFLCVCLSMSVSRHVCHSVHLEVRG